LIVVDDVIGPQEYSPEWTFKGFKGRVGIPESFMEEAGRKAGVSAGDFITREMVEAAKMSGEHLKAMSEALKLPADAIVAVHRGRSGIGALMTDGTVKKRPIPDPKEIARIWEKSTPKMEMDGISKTLFHEGRDVECAGFYFTPRTCESDVFHRTRTFWAEVRHPGETLMVPACFSEEVIHSLRVPEGLREMIVQTWVTGVKEYFSTLPEGTPEREVEHFPPPGVSEVEPKEMWPTRWSGPTPTPPSPTPKIVTDQIKHAWRKHFPILAHPEDPELDDGQELTQDDIQALRREIEAILWPRGLT
jgi:hypothetical protein